LSGSKDLHLPIAKTKKKNISRKRNKSVLVEDPYFYGGFSLQQVLPKLHYQSQDELAADDLANTQKNNKVSIR